MLYKLQQTTLVPAQLIGYSITLFIGISVILTTVQLFLDVKPLLYNQTVALNDQTAIISKNVSLFKTINKEAIYFTPNEISELRKQVFVKEISKFNSASFKIVAYSEKHENIPIFYTDLFFESIPSKHIDVVTNEWIWDSTINFIPIVVPKNYLNLYNFGFAESQGLPLLSENTISQIEFNIRISGNKQSNNYKSKIVGFSDKINSILVPQKFLLWANKKYGDAPKNKASRLLISFNNPADARKLKYFNENNYSINKE